MITTAKVENGMVIYCDVFNMPSAILNTKFPLVTADPPYGNIVNTDWDDAWTYTDYMNLAGVVDSILYEGGSAYIWGGIGKVNIRPFFLFLATLEEEYENLHLHNLITWKKLRGYGKKDDYLFTREELAWIVKGDKPAVFNKPYLNEERGYDGYNSTYPAHSKFKRRTNVWTDVNEILRGKKHQCEKPEKLAEIQIETHTKPGDVVLDLFSGSGNVSKVSQRMDRKFIAIDNNKETFDKIVAEL